MNGALVSLSLHGYGVLYLLVCMLHSIVCTIGLLCVIKRHVGYGFGFEGTEDGGFPEQLRVWGCMALLPITASTVNLADNSTRQLCRE